MPRKAHLVWLVALVVLVLPLSACGSQEKVPTAAEIVQKAAKAVTDSQSFHFEITTSGAPAYLDANKTMALNTVTGDLQRPDNAQATLNVSLMGAVFEIGYIATGGQQYWTNPITGKWELVPSGLGYSPSILFDSQQGVAGVVGKIRDLSLVGKESITGMETYHVKGVASGSDINKLTSGTIQGDNIKIDLWVNTDNFQPVRLQMEQPAASSQQSTIWTLNVSKYNESVDIKPPI